jgi:predicted nucleotidyltransferase
MNRDDAIQILQQLRPRLEARGIAHAGLFGSVSRDAARATSDVDVVVTPAPGRHLDLFDLGGVQSVLEEGFAGLEVDLLVEPIKRQELREDARPGRCLLTSFRSASQTSCRPSA